MSSSARVALLITGATLTTCSMSGCRDAARRAAPSSSASVSGSVTRPPPPPPSAEELALIAPIARGSEIDGFIVRDVRGVEDGRMRLVCVKDEAVVRLDVALLDSDGPLPPASAGRYAVYYSLKGATPEDGDKLARRLARALGAHADSPPPAGMTRFIPRDKPGTSL